MPKRSKICTTAGTYEHESKFRTPDGHTYRYVIGERNEKAVFAAISRIDGTETAREGIRINLEGAVKFANSRPRLRAWRDLTSPELKHYVEALKEQMPDVARKFDIDALARHADTRLPDVPTTRMTGWSKYAVTWNPPIHEFPSGVSEPAAAIGIPRLLDRDVDRRVASLSLD